MKSKLTKFAQVAGIMLALTFTLSCSGGGDVSTVKKGTLQLCPDFTVEQMFDAFLEKPKWKGTSENGIDYVNVSGITAGSGKPANILMQFWVKNGNFGVQAVEINGEAGEAGDVLRIINMMCAPLIKEAEAEQAKKQEAERAKRASKGAISAEP